jgi:tRNA pseudouridine38-40 synthase
MPDRNIRLVVAYDGTDFSGWQRQKKDRSVQGDIEDALGRMHGHPVTLIGAGRTDAGVHATGQVANFLTDISSIPAGNFRIALNSMLPRDVRVVASGEATPGFHARFDAWQRRYRYFIRPGGFALPHELRYTWPVQGRPDAAVLNGMASSILGETDFTTFSSPKDPSLSRFRFVHSASFYPEGACLVFDIGANAFLWRMVRSLVGTMVSFALKGLGPEEFRSALEARNRDRAGPTAPPEGLFLEQVMYPAEGKERRNYPGPGRKEDTDGE